MAKAFIASSSETTPFAVKVTSKSIVKPSSATPPIRRRFKLSFLDTLLPPSMYVTYIVFYPRPANTAAKLSQQILRDSLSRALSRLYPLAGRVHLPADGTAAPPSSVDCNDEGVAYLEAEANQELLHFLGGRTAPDADLLTRTLTPPRPSGGDGGSDMPPPLASVQVTEFKCGGMAVGVSVSHVVADSVTIATLLKTWAAAAVVDATGGGSSTEVEYPYAHDMAASLFPIKNDAVSETTRLVERMGFLRQESTASPDSNGGNGASTVVQRLVFKQEAISALKSKVKITDQGGQTIPPSRAVAILGLIWRSAINARRELAIGRSAPRGCEEEIACGALTIVNIRPRLRTPLRDCPVGNFYWMAAARYDGGGDRGAEEETNRLANVLHESIQEVDNVGFVESLEGEKGHGVVQKWVEERGRIREYTFNSALKTGMNEADFGWGRPIWVAFLGATDEPSPDVAFLVKANHGDDDDEENDEGAVEAWVNLDEKEMVLLEEDPQLLQYALVNPAIV